MSKQKTETQISGDELNAKIQIHIDEAEINYFRDDNKRRYKIERRNKTLVIMGVTVVVVFMLCIILPNGLNYTGVSAAWYFEMVAKNTRTVFDWLSGTPKSANYFVIIQYMIVAIVGAALSVSGAVYQGAFRNALASPTTLGVQTGGVLGGTIFVLFFMGKPIGNWVLDLPPVMSKIVYVFMEYAISFFILGGCLLMVVLVLLTAKIVGRGNISSLTLILSGTVFGGCVMEVLSLIQYDLMLQNSEDVRVYALRYMMMGTFTDTYTPEHLMLLGIPIIIGIIVIMLLRSKLNLLVFGEDEATTMGINVKLIRYATIIVVTALTAIVISFCGMIGFVGFIIPHMARKAVGPDFRYLIPGSALIGAIVMMIVFHVASAVGLSENINVMTSIVGGAIFIAMIVWFRRRGHADWA